MARVRVTDEGRSKQGRGRGTGRDFDPWIHVGDFGSTGRVTRELGWKTRRLHHLLSDLEARLFFCLEWLRSVIDIREQYPLPLNETSAIAAHLGLPHPQVHGKLVVMTTDVLTTVHGPEGPRHRAYAVKYLNELADPREQQKLEIARRWHEVAGHHWGITTENDVDAALAANVEAIHSHRDASGFATAAELARIVPVLTALVKAEGQTPLRDLTSAADARFGYTQQGAGASLAVVYHLIATRQWQIDMSTPLNPAHPLVLQGTALVRGGEDGMVADD